MATFSVDPTLLVALESTICGLYAELSNMHNVAPAFHGVLGGSSLEGEVGNFLGAWHTGVGLIEGDMQKAAQLLGQAAQSYQNSEACIVGATG